MPNGFSSVHELTEEVLRGLGVKSSQVTQGYGYAKASAGYHAPVGFSPEGRRYSPCVDLTSRLIDADFIQRCWNAGLVAFSRNAASGWRGSAHIHAVHVGVRDKHGNCVIPSGPRSQIVDFLKEPPRNGLVGHATLRPYAPNANTQNELRAEYKAWVPDYATTVLSPDGSKVPCYAWMEGDQVVCEVAALLRYFGADVTGHQGAVSAKLKGCKLDLTAAQPYFDGRHWRGGVRGLWQALGNSGVEFEWSDDRISATVRLAY